MSYVAIVPALIPTSEAEVITATGTLLFARELQIDVVDGVFASTISWPYLPKGEPMVVKPYTDRYTLEVDLMVANPIEAATEWVKAGADMVVFHVESLPFEVFKSYCEASPISVGVALHGSTTLETFIPYAQVADYIQVMGVETIGAQAQAFDVKTLDTVAELRRLFPDYSISVDGGVNQDTIVALKKAGADRFVAGSAIIKQSDPETAYHNLCSLVRE